MNGMSFREVVDSASVASCLVKVSSCEVVDSTPQASESFREVVDTNWIVPEVLVTQETVFRDV